MKGIIKKHQQKQELLQAIQFKKNYIDARIADLREVTENRAKLLKDRVLLNKIEKAIKSPASKEVQELIIPLKEKNLKFAADWQTPTKPRLDQLNYTRKIQAGLIDLVNQSQVQRG